MVSNVLPHCLGPQWSMVCFTCSVNFSCFWTSRKVAQTENVEAKFCIYVSRNTYKILLCSYSYKQPNLNMFSKVQKQILFYSFTFILTIKAVSLWGDYIAKEWFVVQCTRHPPIIAIIFSDFKCRWSARVWRAI